MDVLITGGAGFIGSHVARKLLERGDSVVIVDNFNGYYDPKIKTNRMSRLMGDFEGRVTDVRSDIRHRLAMESVFAESEEIDAILHLAAQAGVRYSINHPLEVENINVSGTVNMLELAVQFGVENFVFASSSSVYGNRTNVPFREEDNTDHPESPYAASKKACELWGYDFSNRKKLNVTGLRFFTVYGPDSRPDMAHRKFADLMIKKGEIAVYGDGSMARDFTYVDDTADGVISALDNPFRFEIFNLGNYQPHTVNEVIESLERGLNLKANVRYEAEQSGDVKITYPDSSKAQRMLGYEPRISFEEGMKRFCEWAKGEYLGK